MNWNLFFGIVCCIVLWLGLSVLIGAFIGEGNPVDERDE